MTRRFFLHGACIALVLGFVLSTAAGEPKKYVFVPNPKPGTPAVLTGATWTAVGPDFTLRLQKVEDKDRRAYIQKTTGADTDPFATPEGKAPGYVTFVMQLENNGGSNLDFRAQQCWLMTNRKEILHPVGSGSLKARYGMVGREMGPAYESSLEAVVPSQRTLYAGQSMAGLLVYRAYKPNTRAYQLDIQITTPSGDVALVSLPYRRIKVEDLETSEDP